MGSINFYGNFEYSVVKYFIDLVFYFLNEIFFLEKTYQKNVCINMEYFECFRKELKSIASRFLISIPFGSSTTHLETCDVGAEERREFATATLTLTLVAHLIVKHVWLDLDLHKNKGKKT